MFFNLYSKLRRTFVFKNSTNFSISFLGFSTTGYFVSKYFHDKKFEHPLINEAIRIIGFNQQIIELAGYPLTLDINFNSQVKCNDEQCHFTFNVRGPKGQAKVELAGTSKPHSQIKKEMMQLYYVPSFALSYEIYEKRLEPDVLSTIPIKPELCFWKIDQLQVDVGVAGDFRITLADDNEAIPSKKTLKFDRVTERKTLKNIQDEITIRKQLLPQNEQDVEEMRLYRQQEMYRRIGSVRMIMIGVGILGLMGAYTYVQKNKRVNIKRSQLHLQSLEIIKRNPQFRSQFGLNAKFNDQLRGQQVGDEAHFETDVLGKNHVGLAFISGKKNKKTNEWDIQSISLDIKDTNGEISQHIKIF